MKLKNYILPSICYLCILISGCKEKSSLSLEKVQATSIRIDETTPEDSSIIEFVNPFKSRVDKEMDSILAYAPKSLSKKDGTYNTAIGNMMADAVFEMANPVFKSRTGYPFNAVLLNHGGIRAPLSQGPVTTRTTYQIMPFENEVVVVELSGKQMKEMFAYLSYGKAHPISGLQITLDNTGKLKETLIQGQTIIDNETYFIATSDYLQKGGDNMTFLGKPVSILPLDYKIRNVLIDYFKKMDTIAPVRDNRFIKEQEE